jgi:hypothetical protein
MAQSSEVFAVRAPGGTAHSLTGKSVAVYQPSYSAKRRWDFTSSE